MKLKKKSIVFISGLILLTVAIIWIALGNSSLTVRELTVASTYLPDNFSGYRIAQVSDLHNAEFGKKNQKLIKLLSDLKPNIIVVTGDLIDSRNTNTAIALDFAKEAAAIAPVYYVTGNHESRISEYETLESGLEEAGVKVLRNETAELELNGQSIQLIGIDDPSFEKELSPHSTDEIIAHNALKQLRFSPEEYTILLSHRPELLDIYAKNNIDLVFSGHAHGGQIRLPFFGGLAAPNQGLFPKYDSGLYINGSTSMLVSPGLGNSLFPFRVNNPPEILVVNLSKH